MPRGPLAAILIGLLFGSVSRMLPNARPLAALAVVAIVVTEVIELRALDRLPRNDDDDD